MARKTRYPVPHATFIGQRLPPRALAARPWPPAPRDEPSRLMVRLSWPRTVEDDVLDRAKGCLFGQVIGDNLGALVEFEPRSLARCSSRARVSSTPAR